jgi:drug/metabolite transporter (DMT)-like permease
MHKLVHAMARCSAGVSWDFPIEGDYVNAMKILGIVLIIGGMLGLMYGGFSYTKESHETKIGPIVLSVTDKETVNVPIWAGVGAIVIGGLLLVFGSKKS